MAKQKKTDCKYGSKCYRKNPQHLKDYSHPQEEREKTNNTSPESTSNKRSRQEKEKQTISDYFKTKCESKPNSDVDEEPNTKKSKLDENISENNGNGTSENSVDENSDCCSVTEEGDVSAPVSPQDLRESLKVKYQMEMPEDFYLFWEFCKSINSAKPQDALKSSLDLCLCGPFDIMSGRSKGIARNKHGRRPNYLLHYRFYYDPPEFQTVVVANNDSQFHMGYFRDDPGQSPVFVASNCPTETPRDKISPCGDNLFAAVRQHAQRMISKTSGSKKASIQKLLEKLDAEAKRHDLSTEAVSKSMKTRQKKVVCKAFHGAGLVVPVDANEVGYRPVPESPGDLKKMFKKISEAVTESERDQHEEGLQELITLVQFANDEADYGEGLELGMDLFCFGEKIFHPHISMLLPLAYELLNRKLFSDIIKAHLANRLKDGVDELE